MITQKRSLKKNVIATGIVAMAVVLVSLFSLNAQDNPVTTDEEVGGGDFALKTLKDCTKTSGDIVTKRGNTCTSGGSGCESNPC